MKKLLSFNRAVQASLTIIGLLILFHLSILGAIIFFDYAPLDLIWGGEMETVEQLLSYEIGSFLISLVLLFLLLVKSKRLDIPKLAGLTNVAMWLIFGLFLLNTVGNLMAKTNFERYFAIVTGLLSIILFRIAIEKNDDLKTDISSN